MFTRHGKIETMGRVFTLAGFESNECGLGNTHLFVYMKRDRHAKFTN